MATHDLDWNSLRFVLALARRGSLDRAADELGVDPSTVSRRVRALEQGVGARVFDRTGSGHRLTQVGLRVLQTAEQIELTVASMERAADGADDRLEGTVRIATLEAIGSRLAPFLVRFRELHPRVDFEISADPGAARLLHREVDLIITPSRPAQVQLASRRIATLGFGLYAAREYLKVRPFRPDDRAAAHQWLGYQEHLVRLPEARWLEARTAGVTFALRANSLDPLLVAAASGLGLAVLPSWVADADPRLVRLLGPEPLFTRDLWLAVHREARRTARLRLFGDFLAAGLRERLDGAPEAVQAAG